MEYTVFGFYEDNGQRAGFQVEADNPDEAEAKACAEADDGFQAVVVLDGSHQAKEDRESICGAETWQKIYGDRFDEWRREHHPEED